MVGPGGLAGSVMLHTVTSCSMGFMSSVNPNTISSLSLSLCSLYHSVPVAIFNYFHLRKSYNFVEAKTSRLILLLHILVHFLQIKSSVVTILGLVWSSKNLLQETEYEQFQTKTTRIDTLRNGEVEARNKYFMLEILSRSSLFYFQ